MVVKSTWFLVSVSTSVLWPGIRKSLGLKKWRYTVLYNFNRTLKYYPPVVELVSVSQLGVKLKLSCVKILNLHFKTGQLQIILCTLPASLSCAKKQSKITSNFCSRWKVAIWKAHFRQELLHSPFGLKTYSVLRATQPKLLRLSVNKLVDDRPPSVVSPE